MGEHVVVYHCGGRGGVHRSWEDFPARVTYVSFEPEAEAHAELAQLEGEDKGPQNGLVFVNENTALSNSPAPAQLNVYSAPDLSSFFEFDPAASHRYRYCGVEKTATIDIECSTVDVVAARRHERPDFLCLDVQGAELSILQGAAEMLRHGVLGIRCEVEFLPLYRDQPLFGDVLGYLQDFGFCLARLERPGSGAAGFSLDSGPFSLTMDDAPPAWADAIFMRAPDTVLDCDDASLGAMVLKYVLFAFANDCAPVGFDLLYAVAKSGRAAAMAAGLSADGRLTLYRCAADRLALIEAATWQDDTAVQEAYHQARLTVCAALDILKP